MKPGWRKSSALRPALRRVLRGDLLFWCLFLVALLYSGTAWSLIGWLNTYLDQLQLGTSSFLTTSMVSFLFVAPAGGRLFWGRYADRLGYSRVMLICALGAALACPWVVISTSPPVLACSVAATGLFFSGLYPTAVAYATGRRPELARTITGMPATAMSLGYMSVPWLTGRLAEGAGFRTGLGMSYALVLLLAFIAVALPFLEKKDESRAAGGLETNTQRT